MNRSRTSSTSEKATVALLWGCELNQEKPTCTFRPQKEGKQDCKLLLSTICLGEKAREEMNLVEILPPAGQDNRKRKAITLASLRASVLPMVVLVGLELSPPVTFQLRAGSGPVFLSGQECYDPSDLSWEEDEEEEEGPEEEEEEEDDDDDDDDDIDVSLEKETPVKQVKRLAPQKQTSVAKVREEHHPPPWARPPELSALRPGPDLPGAQREPALAPSLTHTPHNACVWFLEEKGGKRRGSEVTVNLAKTFKLVEVLST
ncbi:nucleoplasmin-2 isoform X1 [Phacochoerus africanus]|uniref:nucleoplasmin-2 isoform X1 n=1 Tax=Phacochoerus africanus TaxID=41426 RepID=UPI001FD9610C|nr:nucleoplasmin-2 isoform X1 [Phacochoerus africanus]